MPETHGATSGVPGGQSGLGTVATETAIAPAPAGADVAQAPEAQHPGPQVAAWAGDLSGRVIDGVGWLKARTTVPVVKILRAIVYGLIVVVAAMTALVLAVLGVVRMWDVYLPVHPVGRRVWLGYVVLGAVLFLVGGALLVRRTAPKDKS
jgi:hypothetical protein